MIEWPGPTAAIPARVSSLLLICVGARVKREFVVLMAGPPGGRRCVRLVGDVVVVRAGARAYLGPRSGRAAGR